VISGQEYEIIRAIGADVPKTKKKTLTKIINLKKENKQESLDKNYFKGYYELLRSDNN
jgi:hypothetical protein